MSRRSHAFTLIETLVVIAIIALLVAILAPALSRSRGQAKAAYCLSRLKDIGVAVGTYAADNADELPPATVDWHRTLERGMKERGIVRSELPVMYGWAELLYEHVEPNARVDDWSLFPAQRNFENKYGQYFNCPQAKEQASHGAHFRAYNAGWANEHLLYDDEGRVSGGGLLSKGSLLTRLHATLPLMGDSNEYSDRGDYEGRPWLPNDMNDAGCPEYETSTLGVALPPGGDVFNTANDSLPACDGTERTLNRFSHRHSGGANYLLGDFHAERSTNLRLRLACDWNLDGVHDPPTEASRRASGCPHVDEP